METPYEAFRRSVLSRVNVARGYAATKADDKTDRVIAAAAVVLSKKGAEWCLAYPKSYADLTLSNLGMWVKLGVTVLGIFTGGSSIWLTILGAVIPAVLDVLHARQQSYGSDGYAGDYGDEFATEANRQLKGTR